MKIRVPIGRVAFMALCFALLLPAHHGLGEPFSETQTQEYAPVPNADPIAWRTLAQGLELGTTRLLFAPQDTPKTVLAIVRIHPEQFRFSLHMATHTPPARSFAEWGKQYTLLAGINASMYLQDNLTSTGYMRGTSHTNNSRIGSNLGAFFVAEPKQPGLPLADILETGDPNLEARLQEYAIVVQNYRLITRKGHVPWKEGGSTHSVAVVANDNEGRILFILCEQPLTPTVFASVLQNLGLQLGTVMYVEGGAQAGLFYASNPATPHMLDIIKGRQSFLQSKGNPHAPLPNIIGISPR